MSVRFTPYIVAILCSLMLSKAAHAQPDWNQQGIKWMSYKEGTRLAQQINKPVLAVFHATWCHYCAAYSQLFHDPRVVEASKHFIMVSIDVDQNGLLNAVYAERGSQIPRTLFMQPNGTPVYDFSYSDTNYPYFVEYRTPDDLLGLMTVGVAEVSAAQASTAKR